MEAFLSILKIKGLQGRTVAAYGKRNVGADGSQAYARGDGRHEDMTILDTQVTIRSAMSEKNRMEIEQMAKEIHA